MPTRHNWFILIAIFCLSLCPRLADAAQTFDTESLPGLPEIVEDCAIASHGSTLIAITAHADNSTGGASVYVLKEGADAWHLADTLEGIESGCKAVSTPQGVVLIGSQHDSEAQVDIQLLTWNNDQLSHQPQPSPPTPIFQPTAITANGSRVILLVEDDTHADTLRLATLDLTDNAPNWVIGTKLETGSYASALLQIHQGKLYLFGRKTDGQAFAFRQDADPKEAGETWRSITSPPDWKPGTASVPFGLAHILFFTQTPDAPNGNVIAYHTITDTWIRFSDLPSGLGEAPAVTLMGDQAVVICDDGVLGVRPAQLKTNYGWLDNAVVIAYLLGMVGVGWYFTKRENSSNDFFRGGQRIPWWAAGMSLFATGASAISLAGMPGMGFGTDWTYFVISICSAICLPIGIFIMAPLVRRLQISTANEYLERRFGITSRLFASIIFMFTQVASRIASVMLLSAIALEAITDMDIMTAIIIMGVVTTIYTYLGGLEAVIWTDTIQGFVMVTTVVGCLLLALFMLDMPFADMWIQAQAYDKFHMFDFSNSLVGPTTFIFFVHTLFLTFGGISDQNFVQRVQSTPDLKQTKLAVATQMAVAVPINVLLFSLGTALWLFYRTHPESLSPTIVNNDGVFPFFAAQQLPIGVSGIVVAALLAATMSTVSSSICAVSDLGTNDFFRRFKKNATDHQCLILGRILTAVVGLSGTLAAIMLASIENVKSVWDLAIMVTGLISSSVIGLFMLGLVTRKTHELGALIGAAVGMVTIILMRMYCPITFWLYIVIGPIVTILVGTLASLVLPGQPRQTNGLTLYTLSQATGADGQSSP